MQVQAHFSGIGQAIARQLEAATESVRVLVYLFTDRNLFEILVSCQRRGIAVTLIISDSDSNRQSAIAWERLSALGARIVRLPEVPGSGDEFFCLVDDATVISGNFRWTSIQDPTSQVSILTQCDSEIADYYKRAFARLVNEPWQTAGIDGALSTEAMPKHDRGLSPYQDPKLDELRLQVRMMEARISAVETEIADMHRQIHLFDHQQEQAIGDLMRRYLDLKRRHLQAKSRESPEDLQRLQARAAEEVYRQYQEARAAKSEEEKPELLDPLEQRELKQLYRKLAMQCHPDRVRDEDKSHANLFFQQLQLSFQNSDLGSLRKLKIKIEAGLGSKAELISPDQFQHIEKHLKELERTLSQRNHQWATVSQGQSWKELSSKPDWTEWFNQQAKRLKAAMQHYMTELDRASQELRA